MHAHVASLRTPLSAHELPPRFKRRPDLCSLQVVRSPPPPPSAALSSTAVVGGAWLVTTVESHRLYIRSTCKVTAYAAMASHCHGCLCMCWTSGSLLRSWTLKLASGRSFPSEEPCDIT